MPYKHSELSKAPLEYLDEETKVGFNIEKLPKEQRDAYYALQEDVISQRYGEPLDVASHIFTEFEGKKFDSENLKINATAR